MAANRLSFRSVVTYTLSINAECCQNQLMMLSVLDYDSVTRSFLPSSHACASPSAISKSVVLPLTFSALLLASTHIMNSEYVRGITLMSFSTKKV